MGKRRHDDAHFPLTGKGRKAVKRWPRASGAELVKVCYADHDGENCRDGSYPRKEWNKPGYSGPAACPRPHYRRDDV